MSIAALMLLAAAGEESPALTRYRALTVADVPCKATAAKDELVVCGRREADRYRVPLTSIPVRDQVPVERNRLLENKVGGCGRVGGFYSGCGFAGVTVTSGGAGTQLTGRKLAP